MMSLWRRALFILCVFTGSVCSAQDDVSVLYEFFGQQEGAPEGHLVFYLAQDGPQEPKLVVRLSKEPDDGIVVAELFDVPEGLDHVPVSTGPAGPIVENGRVPTVTISALGETWTRDGAPNYDVDILVRGPVFAMWGLSTSSKLSTVPNEQLLAKIIVRTDETGVPTWDLRRLSALDHFRGEGVYRTNYAERKCDSPIEFSEAASSIWPFVSSSSVDESRLLQGPGFEQRNGTIEPLVRMDWSAGKIVTISEVVTARNQGCAYVAYSLNEFEPGELNDLNFEAPFAFYDLSSTNHAFPNLVVRTERYPAGDPWSVGIDPEVQEGRATTTDVVNVRYTWSNQIGDGTWDYKLDVVGPKAYDWRTVIGGGIGAITAPPYDEMPSWVMDQEWPAVAFISVEGRSYSSNEGIYSWFGTTELGAYVTGLTDVPSPDAYGTTGRGLSRLEEGLRGEFVYGRQVLPRLYFSEVDNRLHLHDATSGIWLLDDTLRVEVSAVPGSREINHWKLIENLETVSELVDFGEFFIYSDSRGVMIRENNDRRRRFSVAPPTDPASWNDFIGLTRPLENIGRDPRQMESWLASFPGQTWYVPNARLRAPRLGDAGPQFVIDSMRDGTEPPIVPWVEQSSWSVDSYVVRLHDGDWSANPARPPVLTGSLGTTRIGSVINQSVDFAVSNTGDTDYTRTIFVEVEERAIWSKDGLRAGERVEALVSWPNPSSGDYVVRLVTPDEEVEMGTVYVPPHPRVSGAEAFRLSAVQPSPLALGGLLTCAFVIAVISLLWAWRRA